MTQSRIENIKENILHFIKKIFKKLQYPQNNIFVDWKCHIIRLLAVILYVRVEQPNHMKNVFDVCFKIF